MNCKLDMVTDEELARQSADGDIVAFDEIVHRYCRPLTRFITSRTAILQDAEDVVQETFLRAYQNIATFDNTYSFKNWLYTIAYRTSVSVYRKKRVTPLSLETVPEKVDTSVEPEAADDGIWSLVRDMKPDDHTVLWLRYKQEMEMEEIAQVMKKTKTGVRVLLHRARNRLAEKMRTVNESDISPADTPNRTVCIERVK